MRRRASASDDASTSVEASKLAVSKKQCLINLLGVKIRESAGLIDSAQDALAYKISRFLLGSLVERLMRASEGLDEIRLFVGDRIYALVFVYRALHGRIEFLMQESLHEGHFDPWWEDSFVYQVLPLVLSQAEIGELQNGQLRFDRLRSMLETKLLQECQPILSGEAAAHFSLKQAMAIQEAIRAFSGQGRVNSPPE